MKKVIMVMVMFGLATCNQAFGQNWEAALSVLDNAASLAPLPRRDHQLVLKSVNIIRTTIEEMDDQIPEKKKDAVNPMDEITTNDN